MKKKRYMVIIGYAICPFYISVPLSLVAGFAALIDANYLAFPYVLLVSFAGVIYLIPALMLGIFCHIANVHRNLFNILAVSLLGGVFAVLWTHYGLGWGNYRMINLRDFVFGIEFYLAFLTAIVSGVIFLPRRDRQEIG